MILASICLYALHMIIAKGKTSESETLSFKEEDGKTSVDIHREVTYGIGPGLASILKKYLTGGK